MRERHGLDDDTRVPGLSGLGEIEPPAELEERVVAALRERGLLAGRAPGRRRRGAAARLAAAAALVLVGVGAGLLVGRWSGGDASPIPPEGRYLLLLREDASFRAPAGAGEEYGAWLRRLREAGRGVWGAELTGEAALLGEGLGPPPGAGRVTGLFVIQASDLSEAAAVAATCPHLRYGGGIEVRPIRH